MMDGLVRWPNAIWWVQFRLGRGRRLLLVCMCYLGGLLALTYLYRRLEPTLNATQFASFALGMLAALQPMIVIVGGCNAIFRVTARDHATGMIESHRLSPLSTGAATLGYLFGGTQQVLALFLINLLYGLVLSVIGGLPPADWLVGSMLLLVASMSLWSVVVCSGTGAGKPINPMVPMVVVGLMSWSFLMFLPGLGLASGAYATVAAYLAMTGHADLGPPAAPGMPSSRVPAVALATLALVALVMTWFWIAAAARRYRRPYRPAFDAWHGTVLLGGWLLMAGPGIVLFRMLDAGRWIEEDRTLAQFIASLIISMLIAVIGINGACLDRARLLRGATPKSRAERFSGRTVAVVATVLICAVMASVGSLIEDHDLTDTALSAETLRSWACTAVAILAALIAIDGLLRVMHRRLGSVAALTGMFIFLTWVLPLLVDYALALLSLGSPDVLNLSGDFGVFFGCSPVGTILILWTDLKGPVWTGLIVQCLIGAAAQALGSRAERLERQRRRRELIESTVQPA